MNRKTLLSLGAAAAVLAACGGGSDNDTSSQPTSSNTVPASASQSAEGFTAYLQTLAQAPTDTGEAADLSQFLPPTSETAEPNPVN